MESEVLKNVTVNCDRISESHVQVKIILRNFEIGETCRIKNNGYNEE
jgi:hypothetical protein